MKNLNKKKVLITWKYIFPELKNFNKFFKKEKINYTTYKNKKIKQFLKEKDLLKVISNYDGILCGDDEITKKVINKATKLKVISKWGTGLNSINVSYAKKRGIKIFNSPKAFIESVSVYAIGMIINLSRHLIKVHNSVKAGKWEKFSGIELKGKKLGIIGYGKIGKRIAKLAKAFGLKILINDTKKTLKKNIEKKGYYFLNKTSLLKKCDFLCLATDLNETSYHLISHKEFSVMKKNLILINISRGPVINEESLIKALKKNKIFAAGLDVFENEPLHMRNQLRKLKNCEFSSHNAFNTLEAVKRTHRDSIFNLINGLKIKK
tara:strand:+ start:28838 stop:29800 length:963 start_codon:yes stop_codon:yes gene_type:complete